MLSQPGDTFHRGARTISHGRKRGTTDKRILHMSPYPGGRIAGRRSSSYGLRLPLVVFSTLLVAIFWRLFIGEGLSSDGALLKWQPWSDMQGLAPARSANPLLRDQYAVFNANEEFISRWVRRGVWPLWNPDIAHGVPSVASLQNAEYYPINLLFWLLPPFWSRGIRAILKVSFCLVATFALARSLGISRAGATSAATSYAFCGFNTVWLGHPPPNVSLLLPGMLFTLEKMLRTGSFRWGVALALCAGAALLGGHPPTVFHVSIPILIYYLHRQLIAPTRPRPVLPFHSVAWRLVLCTLAAGAIGSVALLPWVEYLSQNPGDILPFRHIRVLSWRALVTWIIPDFFGHPTSVDWASTLYRMAGWENYCERTGFTGVAALMLAIRGLASRRYRSLALPWIVALGASVALIYDLPIVGDLGRELPVFRSVNNSKMLSVAAFAVAMLAGMGFDTVLNRRESVAWTAVSWTAMAAAVGALLWALWPDGQGQQWLTKAGLMPSFLSACIWALLPAMVLTFAAAVARMGKRAAAAWMILAVSMVEMWRFASAFHTTIPRTLAAPATDGIRYLAEHATRGRVLPIGRALLPGNTMLRYGVADARGGDWINVRHYEFLVTGRSGDYDFGYSLEQVPPTLQALNVSYLVFPRATPLPAGSSLAYDGEMRIVRVGSTMPRVLLVHDYLRVESDAEARRLIASGMVDLRRTVLITSPGDPLPPGAPAGATKVTEYAKIISSTPNEVRVAVSARKAGFLVLTDTFYPGWRCTIDGREAVIHRANVAFRAVYVTPGLHDVVFGYRPPVWFLGLGLAAATIAVIAAVSGAAAVRAMGRRASAT